MRAYDVIRSRRRTISLEITGEGRVLVRAPLGASEEAVGAFVAKHEGWLQKHLASFSPREEATEAEKEALIQKARAELPGLVAAWSKRMGVEPTGITITGARKRYGSCSGKNRLCFSYYLMRCPREAVELVVVHELCHIKEKNHGPGFYALLGYYLPDYQARKKLLR